VVVTTDDELAKLETEGLDPQSPIWVAHFFSHFGSIRPERQAFQAAIAAAGFGFGVGGEIGRSRAASCPAGAPEPGVARQPR
jgi:hypothetical protein